MKAIISFLILLIVILPQQLLAHGEHGTIPDNVLHIFGTWEHSLVLAAFVLVLFYLIDHKAKKHHPHA